MQARQIDFFFHPRPRMRRSTSFVMLWTLVMLLATIPCFGATREELVAAGDAFFANRAENHQADWASTVPVERALSSYLQAYELGDHSAELAAKIMRASYFYATYAEKDREKEKEALQRAIRIGEEAIKRNPDDAALNYQLGGCWGRWGEVNGIMASARKGVAQKVREFGEKTAKLDPGYAQAGGYRTLGRLHFKAPRIPIVLSWPNKNKALAYLEKAVALGPENLTNHLFYAESLYHAGMVQKALDEVTLILGTPANPLKIVEDLRDQKEAQTLKEKIAAEYAQK